MVDDQIFTQERHIVLVSKKRILSATAISLILAFQVSALVGNWKTELVVGPFYIRFNLQILQKGRRCFPFKNNLTIVCLIS